MTIQNLIVNGGFETRVLSPWVGNNVTITSQYLHTGSFSARLQGGNVVSFIIQTVSVSVGEGFEFLVSFSHTLKGKQEKSLFSSKVTA